MFNESQEELPTVLDDFATDDLSIEELDGLSGGLSSWCLGTVGCPISSVGTLGPN